MLKREAYIKRISSALAHFQAELELNNAAGFFDGNHTAEDFACGLLNLVYGCRLENRNHRQKNAAAVDLTDEANRFAVQVTSDNTRGKIQSTIDRFLAHELYRDYDQLFVLLLRDRKDYQKPFETGGYFSFSAERHIEDLRGLSQKIAALDTGRLRKIDAYLRRELVSRDRRRRLALPGAICLALLLLFAVGASLRGKPASRVYLSKLQPYTETGSYDSYLDVPPVHQAEMEVHKAFSILSFVRCESPSPSRVEDVSCRILDLEPVEEPVLLLDACIVEQTLKLFAYNNGWGPAEAPVVETASIRWRNHLEPLRRIAGGARLSEAADVAPAGASLLAEYDLDVGKFQDLRERYGGGAQGASLAIEVRGENCSAALHAFLDVAGGGFRLDSGGIGDQDTGDITLFAVLDVDKKPSYVTFAGEGSTPRVEDTLRVETVLAPRKSCLVRCRNVFLVDGGKQESDVYTVRVTVPAFSDSVRMLSNPLTEKLAGLEDLSSAGKILEEYRYDPYSLYPQNPKSAGA